MLALEAYEMASLKKYDVCVLVTGDGDFIPLVKKLNTLGSRVMLIGWDFSYVRDGKNNKTQVSKALFDRVNYPIQMHIEIDSKNRQSDDIINNLFMSSQGDTDNYIGSSSLELEGRHLGTIDNISEEKGFAFIRPDTGGENLFFHMSALEGCEFKELKVGDDVVFSIDDKTSSKNNSALKVNLRANEQEI